MTSAILGLVYVYTFVELALDLGAVYYAYRLTRITGVFTGWMLMIAAVVLITLQNTSSIITLALFFPESQLESILTDTGIAAVFQGAAIGIALSLTLFGAMWELYRTFRRLQTKQAA